MSVADHKFTNRLIHEQSPYLLQHAHNPVSWYPWGELALQRAKQEQKPILVSIGYATCHWCHVMERESFEDDAVAEFLNEHFIAIKVDREERPDVDKIYMEALHALGTGGGWPLNMFLTPEAVPFTGGTYFPPNSRPGRPSFLEVLQRVLNLWQKQRDKVVAAAASIRSFIDKSGETSLDSAISIDESPENSLIEFAKARYDSLEGGFQNQPQNKFPPSMQLIMLLRCHERLSDEHLVEIVEHTIEKMKHGGIYDQIGGGLSRYATDYSWLVPHFEKMLYDNALWIELLVEAYQSFQKPCYKAWAYDALTYIRRDMLSPEGAFYSAEDADSEGHEGKFYIWSKAQFFAIVGADAELLAQFWDVTADGNFEGANILHETQNRSQFASKHDLPLAEFERKLSKAREALFNERVKRIRPLLDDKVLTSWNAMMISAFAKAARAFNDQELFEIAARAARFLLQTCRDSNGRLLRRYRAGDARFKAYLVDYAQLANACIDLFEVRCEPMWLEQAQQLLDTVDQLFTNPQGGFFDTGSDAEKLIVRTMEGYDGVEPSGNSATAVASMRLHGYLQRQQDLQRCEHVIRSFWQNLTRASWGYAYMMRCLEPLRESQQQIIVLGREADLEFQAIRAELQSRYLPDSQVLVLNEQQAKSCAELSPVAGRTMLNDQVTIYICENFTCQLPFHSLKKLQEQLS